jgi:hypothetical protein
MPIRLRRVGVSRVAEIFRFVCVLAAAFAVTREMT